jgi:hypothetical protein
VLLKVQPLLKVMGFFVPVGTQARAAPKQSCGQTRKRSEKRDLFCIFCVHAFLLGVQDPPPRNKTKTQPKK